MPFFASSLDYAAAVSLPPRVWAATGGVMLGLGLAPAFCGAPPRLARPGVLFAWWAPVAGVSLGLLLGSVAAPGTATDAVLSVVVGQVSAKWLPPSSWPAPERAWSL